MKKIMFNIFIFNHCNLIYLYLEIPKISNASTKDFKEVFLSVRLCMCKGHWKDSACFLKRLQTFIEFSIKGTIHKLMTCRLNLFWNFPLQRQFFKETLILRWHDGWTNGRRTDRHEGWNSYVLGSTHSACTS